MSGEKRSPVGRMQIYVKDEKRAYDVASLWPNDRFDFKVDVSPVFVTDRDCKFPKMAFREALDVIAAKGGFLSIVMNKKKDEPKPSGGGEGPSDPDIPFLQRDKRGPF